MKWTYTIKNKLMASGILLMLCILVLISNFIDRNHTDNVKNAINTLYQDRLIAEEYILKMTSGIYQLKEVIYLNDGKNDRGNSISHLLVNFSAANNAFQKTKLTKLEKLKAEELNKIMAQFIDSQTSEPQEQLTTSNKALHVLAALSAIQLEESKQIMNEAENLYVAGKTSSQFVFAIIVIILLVLQALIFASKSIIPKNQNKKHDLN